jgi:hypothetical protein
MSQLREIVGYRDTVASLLLDAAVEGSVLAGARAGHKG